MLRQPEFRWLIVAVLASIEAFPVIGSLGYRQYFRALPNRFTFEGRRRPRVSSRVRLPVVDD